MTPTKRQRPCFDRRAGETTQEHLDRLNAMPNEGWDHAGRRDHAEAQARAVRMRSIEKEGASGGRTMTPYTVHELDRAEQLVQEAIDGLAHAGDRLKTLRAPDGLIAQKADELRRSVADLIRQASSIVQDLQAEGKRMTGADGRSQEGTS